MIVPFMPLFSCRFALRRFIRTPVATFEASSLVFIAIPLVVADSERFFAARAARCSFSVCFRLAVSSLFSRPKRCSNQPEPFCLSFNFVLLSIQLYLSIFSLLSASLFKNLTPRDALRWCTSIEIAVFLIAVVVALACTDSS